MEALLELFKELYSTEGLRNIIQTGGIWLLIGIIFAETGLLAGFFLPGDSLLITAGIFASSEAVGGEPLFSITTLLSTLTIAAIVGDQVGFLLGRKAGPMVYKKKDSFFFRKAHLKKAQEFYEQHGGKAIVIARFAPFLRTFVPFVAGVAEMPYRKFVYFNIFGGFLWIWSMCLIGYFLGATPLANSLPKVILVVVFVSLLPIIIPVTKSYLLKRKHNRSQANGHT